MKSEVRHPVGMSVSASVETDARLVPEERAPEAYARSPRSSATRPPAAARGSAGDGTIIPTAPPTTRGRATWSALGLAGILACTAASEDPDAGSAVPSEEDLLLDVPEAKKEILCDLTGPPSTAKGDVLIHEDNFDGKGLDLSKWNVAEGYRGHGAILNTTSPKYVEVSNGLLSITTDRNLGDPRYPYVSGFVDSLGKFARTYGRIEMRARFPFVPGVWFAMWGRPWTQSFPEVDIEVLNASKGDRGQLYFVNHWAAPPIPADERRAYSRTLDVDLTAFHDYTIDWRPDALTWSIDGEKKLEAPAHGIPHLPVYWMINAWVGGWSGAPDERTFAPAAFAVDHVRVYRVDGLVAYPQITVLRPRALYSRSRPVELAVANFDEVCAHVTMYDGDRKIWTTSRAPFRFSVRRLSLGQHTLRFVATDGERRVETSLQVAVER